MTGRLLQPYRKQSMNRGLLQLCADEGTPFCHYVNMAIDQFGAKFRIELADHFEVSEPTINHWAWGIGNPHPALRQLVREYIHERALWTLSSLALDSAEKAHLAWANNPEESRTAPQMMVDWLKSALEAKS